MTAIEQILTQPWSQRLGWSLLHFLWQGIVIAALLSVAMTALRRRSANLRYALACMALVVMVAAPVATFCVISAGPTRDAPADPTGQETPDAAIDTGEHAPPAADVRPSGAPILDSVPDAAPAEAPAEAILPVASPDADHLAPPVTIGWTARASRFIQPALPWMVTAWVAGVAALAIWHIGGWVGLLRLRRSALPLGQAGPEAQCAQAAGRLAKKLGLSGPIRLLKSARIAGPVAVGILRPAVLMPVTMLTGLSVPDIEAILAHEIAHLRRFDYLVNLLQSLVETVLFYHPAVWWVSSRIRVERENCCDDVAVGVCGDRTTYVTALASLAEASAGVPRARLPRLAAAKRLAPGVSGSVLARARRLLGLPGSDAAMASRWLAGVLIVVSLAVAGVFLCCANTDTTVAAAPPAEAKDEVTTKPADPEVTVERTESSCGYVGRVIDAETGKPVEKFVIQDGWTKQPVANAKDIRWYGTTRRTDGFRNGEFSITHSLPDDRQRFVYFRILADGYLPQLVSDKPLSEPLRYKGVVVRLRRGGWVTGRVLDHAGKPVAGASVFLVSRQRRLELVDGEPEGFTGSSGKTDKDGRFSVPGAGEITTHAVVSCKTLHAWLAKIPEA
ncbi:MAG TPA: M56 family metallopeptidase, partial [Phycisphaerae bacterium]|nr:M56 family metallopeptidase [Phycisphaerae bacterium]